MEYFWGLFGLFLVGIFAYQRRPRLDARTIRWLLIASSLLLLAMSWGSAWLVLSMLSSGLLALGLIASTIGMIGSVGLSFVSVLGQLFERPAPVRLAPSHHALSWSPRGTEQPAILLSLGLSAAAIGYSIPLALHRLAHLLQTGRLSTIWPSVPWLVVCALVPVACAAPALWSGLRRTRVRRFSLTDVAITLDGRRLERHALAHTRLQQRRLGPLRSQTLVLTFRDGRCVRVVADGDRSDGLRPLLSALAEAPGTPPQLTPPPPELVALLGNTPRADLQPAPEPR